MMTDKSAKEIQLKDFLVKHGWLNSMCCNPTLNEQSEPFPDYYMPLDSTYNFPN